MKDLRIDLGCGSAKKDGTIGLDIQAAPGVDQVVDLVNAPLPFPDRSVAYVHSSHFLEHVKDPTRIFAEITRVAADGATLEFWTPYAWENSAFIIDHKMFFNEDHYLHICVWFVDFWEEILKARWLLKEITYVIHPDVAVDLHRRRIPIDHALRYFKGVVKEWGVRMEVRRDKPAPETRPLRTLALERNGERWHLERVDVTMGRDPGGDVKAALAWLRTSR
ncbi:MAG: methyltransferase domain-containing protein [Acidobacteria bacterium]|nr:methyltransferase domain-containing protein [Acidobacteriota bacterium]